MEHTFQSFASDRIDTSSLHQLLLGAVAPRPIAFASTIDSDGWPNLSPYSFFNVFSANPPILIFSPARRVRDNTTKHTLENIKEIPEVVINIVSYPIVEQMSLSSTEYDKGVNEFEKAGLTMLPSRHVKPFRVAESPVQFECKVNEIVPLGKEGGAGNLILCEVLETHVNKDILDESGRIDPRSIDLVARMGGNYYSRAADGLFEIEKPLKEKGIGVDCLPKPIIDSSVFSGNELGRLGNQKNLPSSEEIDSFLVHNPLIKNKIESENEREIFTFAKALLDTGQTEKALHVIQAKIEHDGSTRNSENDR